MKVALSFAWLIISLASFGNNCPEGREAFRKNVFPLLQTHCASCHDGTSEAPAHSVADVEKSYARFGRFVSFGRIPSSPAIKKVETKHWEKYDGEVNLTPDELRRALESWWKDGQSRCVEEKNFSTLPQPLPALSADGFTGVTLPIGAVGSFKDLSFRVEAKILGDAEAGYVLMRNPRISSPADGIEVTGVSFIIDGKPATQANNWRKLRQISFPGRVPTLLANSTVILPIRPKTEILEVRFEKLAKAEAAKCRYLDIYDRDVASVYDLRNCFYCHGGGPSLAVGEPRAVAAFPMSGDRQSVCDMSLQRMHGLEQAALIGLPLRGSQNHPKVLIGDEGALPNWVNWARKEFSAP